MTKPGPDSSSDDAGVDATRRAAAVAHLIELIDAPSVSGDEAPAVDRAEAIARDGLGLAVERMAVAPGRDNLLVGDPRPRVLLCTHLDTVPPYIPARRDATHVHGRGACDAKGVAVAMLHALDLLGTRQAGSGVGCLLVVGEETDHAGAIQAAQVGPRPEWLVLGEPCGLAPARGQKGLLKLRLSATGRAAHSAYPETGASAVHRLLDALERIRGGPLPAEADFGDTTLNVGRIEGGVAANVIAPEAAATLLVRCAAPADAVKAVIVERAGPDVQIRETGRAEPYRFETPGGPPGAAVPFNTDAHTLAPLGAKTVLLGPGDMRCAHGPDERLAIDDLARGIAAYARLARELM